MLSSNSFSQNFLGNSASLSRSASGNFPPFGSSVVAGCPHRASWGSRVDWQGAGRKQEQNGHLVGPIPCWPPAHGSHLTGERVSNLEDLPLNEYRERIQVHTDKGTEVATNLVIVCNGIKVNSSAYHSAFGKWPTTQAASSPSGLCRLVGLSPRNQHRPAFLPPLPAAQGSSEW